jgi:cytochrome c2
VGTCNSCHEYQRGVSQTGPSLKGVGTRAETRIEGVSAAEYIRQSIINPNAYVVKGFSANVMPATFARLLTPTQIDDLVAFLLTLKE